MGGLKPVGGAMRLSGVGEDPELAEFCRAEWPRLVGSLGLYVGDRALAEDLAQEALVRVCTHWKQVREADSPSAWAHRAAFNLAKSHHRRGRTWARIRGRAVGREAPVDTEETTAVAVAVRAAVAALPDAQREALVLRYFADLPVHAVAVAMGCPENTVKTHTRRALDALRIRRLLESDAPESEPETTP
jgi:RNA polymerase sigma-70 factor (ECF subfamily)